jgi:isopenicillin N synthase-like dioxygenase
METLPVIDIAPLLARTGAHTQTPAQLPSNREDLEKTKSAEQTAVASQIAQACKAHGFFYITGHGISPALIAQLESLSHQYFALPTETKMQDRMSLSGRAWRGFFPLGGELTSGKPDWKEGLYLGTELPADHPLVQAKTPLHGPNLFPKIPGFREAILDYMAQVTQAGHALLQGIALSLGLEATYFADRYTADPLILFRIFNYPSQPLPPDLAQDEIAIWGVGEHTDYGLLTLLYQDPVGGLQVKTSKGWIAAPPIANTLICNIGDMLDRMTGGLYRSTPHRVARNTSGKDRLSFPLFFDPNFFAQVQRIPGFEAQDDSQTRWDQANVHAFHGTYGDYILQKVGKVFPNLINEVL